MSEIVIPMVKRRSAYWCAGFRFTLVGDCDVIDQGYLEQFVTILLEKTNWHFDMFGVKD